MTHDKQTTDLFSLARAINRIEAILDSTEPDSEKLAKVREAVNKAKEDLK